MTVATALITVQTWSDGSAWQGVNLGTDLGRMANLKLVDKRVKELVELKLQVLVEVRTRSG